MPSSSMTSVCVRIGLGTRSFSLADLTRFNGLQMANSSTAVLWRSDWVHLTVNCTDSGSTGVKWFLWALAEGWRNASCCFLKDTLKNDQWLASTSLPQNSYLLWSNPPATVGYICIPHQDTTSFDQLDFFHRYCSFIHSFLLILA